ncbi:hypothetical protein ACWEKJ_38590 [Amycolatopsis thermoflava]
MKAYRPELSWQHAESGLVLRSDERRIDVPAALATHLAAAIRDPRDPAQDLLIADDLLRRHANTLRARARELTSEISSCGDRVSDLARQLTEHRWHGRRNVRHQLADAKAEFRRLLAEAEHTSDELHRTSGLIDAVRRLVLDLDLDQGLLGEAARGWRRPSTQPAWVTTFSSEKEFLAADPRRATRALWGGTIADAEFFGDGWRRDDDEPLPDLEPPALAGPWQLNYLPRTGEIYALRRCDHLPEEVWLLADHADDPSRTRSLLSSLGNRRREPNSLLLAATTVHHAFCPAGRRD